MDPEFPTVQGDYQLTEEWWIEFADEFSQRIENDSIVFWKDGLTLWIDVYGNDDGLSPFDQVVSFSDGRSPDAFDEVAFERESMYLFGYKLIEPQDKEIVESAYNSNTNDTASFYCFTAVPQGIVTCCFYFDDPVQYEEIEKIWFSLQYVMENVNWN